MDCWIYKGECLSEPASNAYGFVYKITCLHKTYKGFIYIGSKAFNHLRTKKLSKKRATELYSGKGRKPTKEKVQIASDWLTYCSSSKTLQQLIKELGRENFRFEVLEFAKNKTDLWYKEVENMIKFEVMLIPNSFNECMKFTIYKKQLLK